jgi:hypothetical protein
VWLRFLAVSRVKVINPETNKKSAAIEKQSLAREAGKIAKLCGDVQLPVQGQRVAEQQRVEKGAVEKENIPHQWSSINHSIRDGKTAGRPTQE